LTHFGTTGSSAAATANGRNVWPSSANSFSSGIEKESRGIPLAMAAQKVFMSAGQIIAICL
jgi:hypothetical protein